MGNATHFFLGANSGLGFQSLFESFRKTSKFHDLLILKGGPGCGKSTMMRRLGVTMEERGEQVEYLHCSGDPDSLDGVYFPQLRTAVVDGTAPHIMEPKYPAAVERYVDLGRFYDIGAAKSVRGEIVRHTDACSDAYRLAYRALGAVRQLEENASELIRQGLDRDKLYKRTIGVIGREIRGKGNGAEDTYRYLGSVTCKGTVWRFDSVEQLCPRVYQLLDSAGIAAPLLEQIHQAARERGFACIVCPDAEHTDRLHHLLIPEIGVAFVTSKEGMEYPYDAYRRIHLDAMVDPQHKKRWKGRLKFMRKMTEVLREEGIGYLKEAKAAHDRLEAAYQTNLDFGGIDELTEREMNRILCY